MPADRTYSQSPKAFTVQREGPWLTASFLQPQACLSWAVVGGGEHVASQIVWRRVTDAELAVHVDPKAWLSAELSNRGLAGAVGLMTAADLNGYADVAQEMDGMHGRCLATVGLGNALRAGDVPGAGYHLPVDTINVLAWVSVPLNLAGLLEAMSIVAEARTLAVREANVQSIRSGKPASGTGTDCIVVTCPRSIEAARAYAGKHTAVGHLIGATVLAAVSKGIRWDSAKSK